MMVLAASALRAAANNVFSPSKNACMVMVTPTVAGGRRYRNDPYRACVLAVSPSKVAPPTPEKASVSAKQPLQARAQNYQTPMPQLPVASTPLAVPHSALHLVAQSVPMVPVEVAHAAPVRVDAIRYMTVQFKHTTATYVCQLAHVHVGDWVIVEGDRGINMGTVCDATTTKPSFPVANKVLRVATAQEKESQMFLRRKEAQATRRVIELASTHAPAVRIVDSEFQFDSNKLTVFMTSKRLVDFRQLQRALFREFKVRVWLLYWNEVCPNKPLPSNN